MRILTAGGGSGGHVTPVVAVVRELKKLYPDAEIRFWCDGAFATQARALMHQYDSDMRVDTIISGKFRRYHAYPVWKQLLMFRDVVWPNTRDSFKITAGTVQSIIKLIVWRPDIVFTKGGFVCLPIGFAANVLGIKLIIHDSDAHPGLTNRVLSRWAEVIATGAPEKYYPYPPQKMHYVGIPINNRVPLSEAERRSLKQQLGLPADKPLLVATGGGLGARRINDTVVTCLPTLSTICSVVLVSGEAHYKELRQRVGQNNDTFQLHSFISKNMSDYFAAADVVVTRAGMTTLLELAALARPAIVIPNIHLTGGHQKKNAAVYQDGDAIVVLDEALLEKDPLMLAENVDALLADPIRRQHLSEAIARFAKPNAAADVAALIADVYTKNNH